MVSLGDESIKKPLDSAQLLHSSQNDGVYGSIALYSSSRGVSAQDPVALVLLLSFKVF